MRLGISCSLALLALGPLGCGHQSNEATSPFEGSSAGEERQVLGIKLSWCPAGTFVIGSPLSEPERRPGESQKTVTLTKGFWIAKYEATQGQWKSVFGALPGELTAELPEGANFPVGNVNFAEAEDYCRTLTELAHKRGCCRKAGNSGCRQRRNGSTPRAPGRRRPPRSVTA